MAHQVGGAHAGDTIQAVSSPAIDDGLVPARVNEDTIQEIPIDEEGYNLTTTSPESSTVLLSSKASKTSLSILTHPISYIFLILALVYHFSCLIFDS